MNPVHSPGLLKYIFLNEFIQNNLSLKNGGLIPMKQDQLRESNIEKQPAAFVNINHSGTSYAQNAIEHAPAESSITEEAAENLAKQVMRNNRIPLD